jgi:hypothetical protein
MGLGNFRGTSFAKFSIIIGEGFIVIGLGLIGVSSLEGVLKWSLLFSLSSEDFLGLTRTLASSYLTLSAAGDGTETLVL